MEWTWTWANSRRWWGTGRPGVLQSMGSWKVRHDWVTEQQEALITSRFSESAYFKDYGIQIILKKSMKINKVMTEQQWVKKVKNCYSRKNFVSTEKHMCIIYTLLKTEIPHVLMDFPLIAYYNSLFWEEHAKQKVSPEWCVLFHGVEPMYWESSGVQTGMVLEKEESLMGVQHSLPLSSSDLVHGLFEGTGVCPPPDPGI